MSKKSIHTIFVSIFSMAIVALLGCARHTVEPHASQSVLLQQDVVIDEMDVPDSQDTAKMAPENQTDPHAPSRSERIEVLREKLESLGDADDPDLESNPHRERLQDPAAIQEAIQQLEQGAEICTRCLMECGAP